MFSNCDITLTNMTINYSLKNSANASKMLVNDGEMLVNDGEMSV